MKKFFSICALACAMFAVQSCSTINVAQCSSSQNIGSKVGEATSTQYLLLWTAGGKNQTIQQAAKNGGITKVNQVEYVNQSVLGGLVVKHTTRVYGE